MMNNNNSQSRDLIEKLAKDLETEISEGRVSAAQEITRKLGQLKARLDIEPRGDPQEPDNEITIRVNIEDKVQSGVSIPLKVRSSDTIKQLKRKMLITYQFPEKVQCWIIGRRIPNDHESLYQCNIRSSNCSVFLYLVSAQSVGLTREDFDRELATVNQQNTSVFSSINQSLNNPGPTTLTTLGTSIRTNPPSAAAVGVAVRPNPPPTQINQPPTRGQITADSLSESEGEDLEEYNEGWHCSQCTLINKPTRPGCEMCGADRPEGYEVPADYEISPEEAVRLEEERERDQQVLDPRETEGVNLANIDTASVALLLQLNDQINDRMNDQST